MRIIIRVLIRHRVTHPTVDLKRADHLRRIAQIGTQAHLVAMLTGGRLEVLQSQLETILAAQFGEIVVVGDPDPSTGNCRCTAILVAFLDDQHGKTLVGGE
ncbi:hypothetical protein D3C80_1954340 [compost metagenome]